MNTATSAANAPQAMPPEAVVMQMVMGGFVAQAVYVAAKLGIADLLETKPQSAADLAEQTNMNAGALYRVLRALASVGIFRESEPRTFALTPLAETLLSDSANSVKDAAIWMGEEPHWRVYSEMLWSVETGKPAWERVHGREVFPYLFEENAPLGEIFNRAMSGFSRQAIPAVVEAYDFSNIKTLADIGGGYGHLLAGVLNANPHLRGVLFDLPPVFAGAAELLENENVIDRTELVRGDFFEEIPVSADVYLLKHIIHDWDDERNVKILKNIRAAMPDGAKILIVDAVIPEDNEQHFGKILDLEMLVSPGGLERTESQFRTLLTEAGFRLTRIIPTRSPVSIVEAVKAI
ncbi:MAG: O-demethylpuromycin-O-methyltransferase [uncultured Pyrinomonadaceae bacterium]|uniref:O-demethylpuromycin-O-methyltransferase n=1 Tax=uncultured Pyrinomonadaceae bacterium TaxID=2283094 RepID=A0A6J4PYP5_9BACT|nr:MAG: O-demethylpuromycin-O-methyltransferase [uncultured Pyrinomonadaceae bacterium]